MENRWHLSSACELIPLIAKLELSHNFPAIFSEAAVALLGWDRKIGYVIGHEEIGFAMNQQNPPASLYDRIGGQPGIQKLLKFFYADVQQHALLGPVFQRQIQDWPAHLEKIGRFWAQVTGGPTGYAGGMAARHLTLGIDASHFAVWLQLWEFNCSAHLPPAEAREMIDLAHDLGRRLRAILRVESLPEIPKTI